MTAIKTKIPSKRKSKLSAVIHDVSGGKSKRLAVLLPGYLDSKDYPHLVRLGEDLASVGYVAVRFDPTGTWESEGDISFYTMSQYLRDIQAVVDFMNLRASFVDIVVAGHSLGGRMSVLYGAAESQVSAAVNIMEPTSFVRLENFEETVVKWGREGMKVSVRDLPNDRSEKREFRVPYSFVEDALNYDIAAVVGDFNKPLLFIAGEHDDECPPDEMRAIYKKTSKPKEFVILEGIGHDYRFHESEIRTVNSHVLGFLQRHL